MKFLFATLIFAMTGLTALAQEPAAPMPVETPAPVATTPEPAPKVVEPTAVCDLTVQHSPIVTGGLKLRMSEAEAALKLGAKFESEPAGGGKRVNASLRENPIFENVESGSAKTLDGKVSSIHLIFHSTKWPTVKDYVWNYAPRLGLVRSAFRLDEEKRTAKIVCKDFTVELKTGDTSSEIMLVDTAPQSSAARVQ